MLTAPSASLHRGHSLPPGKKEYGVKFPQNYRAVDTGAILEPSWTCRISRTAGVIWECQEIQFTVSLSVSHNRYIHVCRWFLGVHLWQIIPCLLSFTVIPIFPIGWGGWLSGCQYTAVQSLTVEHRWFQVTQDHLSAVWKQPAAVSSMYVCACANDVDLL